MKASYASKLTIGACNLADFFVMFRITPVAPFPLLGDVVVTPCHGRKVPAALSVLALTTKPLISDSPPKSLPSQRHECARSPLFIERHRSEMRVYPFGIFSALCSALIRSVSPSGHFPLRRFAGGFVYLLLPKVQIRFPPRANFSDVFVLINHLGSDPV